MTPDDDPVSPLAALIRDVIAQEATLGNALNYSDIARRGVDITRNNVQRYATRRLDQLIPLEKRRGLALGLRVHPVVVDTAIAQSLDLMISPSFNYDYRVDPDLTTRDRREINDFIEWIKRGRAHG